MTRPEVSGFNWRAPIDPLGGVAPQTPNRIFKEKKIRA